MMTLSYNKHPRCSLRLTNWWNLANKLTTNHWLDDPLKWGKRAHQIYIDNLLAQWYDLPVKHFSESLVFTKFSFQLISIEFCWIESQLKICYFVENWSDSSLTDDVIRERMLIGLSRDLSDLKQTPIKSPTSFSQRTRFSVFCFGSCHRLPNNLEIGFSTSCLAWLQWIWNYEKFPNQL